jgi:hypothetical protein
MATSLVSDFPLSKRIKNALYENNIFTIDDLKSLSLDKLKSLEGLGDKSLLELREYLYLSHKIVFKKEKVEKKKVIKDYPSSKLIVEHFLRNTPNINWSAQLKIADRLIAQFPLDFLLSVSPPPNIYSLGYFISDFGHKYLTDRMPARLIVEKEEKKESIIEEGEDYTPKDHSKPKHLRDFLGI